MLLPVLTVHTVPHDSRLMGLVILYMTLLEQTATRIGLGLWQQLMVPLVVLSVVHNVAYCTRLLCSSTSVCIYHGNLLPQYSGCKW